MKECFKCKEIKCLSEFYKHKQMKDGHLNKCKECAKKDATEHRWENIAAIRAYDRDRGNRQLPEYHRKYRKDFPNKYKAKNKVNNEIRSGNLIHEPCEVCGGHYSIHAHHDDYLKPLNVRWLCAKHHQQWHRDNGPGLNGE